MSLESTEEEAEAINNAINDEIVISGKRTSKENNSAIGLLKIAEMPAAEPQAKSKVLWES
jgi:hypothetical protein